ncbi:hypothetical protein SAMN06265337_4348 [Hymenobacter gelipurpurascens]|uniref:Uncharacterized protein n=1 Tax=Hymenobacter gelipurpurascens TaxID=89968 RepID=A0A212UHK2_9BACT|nr:hypothetical protein [Hymenobacter gelipurpurascens]SNC77738.1 hypothetical protein SAMN06265337_4348 [Hymenobacter gelipurpurascens]
MAVSPPPKKNVAATPSATASSKLDEKKINAIINRGSSSVAANSLAPGQLKNFNIKVPADTLVSIEEVRAKRPRKPTSPKLGISTQDWLLEAIAEKLEREQKKYKIGVK